MKKVLGGLALAGLLTAGVANAGTITVANSDLVLYGGISAGYTFQDNEGFASGLSYSDTFKLYTAAIGLAKKATPNSPIGFNLALAQFEVPTLLVSSDIVNKLELIELGRTDDGLKPWLAEVDIVPIDGVKIAAGLLWSKYGEKPVTILNNHISRGLMYVFFNPAAYTGVRAEFTQTVPYLGTFDMYVGYNQANGLFQGDPEDADPLLLHTGYDAKGNPVYKDPKDAIEVGARGLFNLGITKVNLDLHYYDESGGRNIWTLQTGLNFQDFIKGGLQFSYSTRDDTIKDYRAVSQLDDSFWGIGLNFNVSLLDAQIANVEFPMRVEYVKLDHDCADADTSKDKIWSFTITPTWKPNANTFVRAEYTYTKADSKMFVDPDVATSKDDSRNTVAVEAGFLF
jgi:opacity protein-like surface antigen